MKEKLIPAASHMGRPRKLTPEITAALVAAWLAPNANRTHVAEAYSLSPVGARKIVNRHLKEAASDERRPTNSESPTPKA